MGYVSLVELSGAFSGVSLARERLRAALAARPPRLDLAALAIATLAHPELDPAPHLATLDGWAARVRQEAARRMGRGARLGRLEALRHVLAHVEGLHGSREDYDAPENSFLPRVMERKTGLPIALSVIYLEVARRAGIELYGVSFPGHFLVACEAGEHKLALDPFNGGDLLTEAGCEELLTRVAPQLRFEPGMLTPAPVAMIAYRMLSNLRRAYLERDDAERGLGVVDLLLELAPDHPGELRTRANLLTSLGAYRAALKDVEKCLALSPQAPDRERLELAAKELRERAELLN